MTMLDQHPEVCASGKSKKPEMCFLRVRPGCQSVPSRRDVRWELYWMVSQKFTEGGTSMDPPQCKPGFEVTDPDSNIDGHRQTLCNFIDALEGDYSKEAVVLKWTEAFVNEDKRFLGWVELNLM